MTEIEAEVIGLVVVGEAEGDIATKEIISPPHITSALTAVEATNSHSF